MSVSMLDVKKGARVRLKNGWEADVMDNCTRMQTRVCNVYGFCTEIGSVYSSDIAQVKVNGKWEKVDLTASQIKAAATRSAWGF